MPKWEHYINRARSKGVLTAQDLRSSSGSVCTVPSEPAQGRSRVLAQRIVRGQVSGLDADRHRQFRLVIQPLGAAWPGRIVQPTWPSGSGIGEPNDAIPQMGALNIEDKADVNISINFYK